jgi:hypothetical protein
VLNDLRYCFRKEIVAPMQIGNCVGKRHHFTSITSTSAARTRLRMSAAIAGMPGRPALAISASGLAGTRELDKYIWLPFRVWGSHV